MLQEHINGSINKSVDAFTGSGSFFCKDRIFSFGNCNMDTIMSLYLLEL